MWWKLKARNATQQWKTTVEKVQASLSASSKIELKRFRSSILSSISFHAIKESSSSSSPFQFTSSFAFQINLILVVDFDRNEIHRIPGLNRAFNCSYQFIRCRNFNHARVRNGNLDLISKFQVDLRYWSWKVVSFSYLIILLGCFRMWKMHFMFIDSVIIWLLWSTYTNTNIDTSTPVKFWKNELAKRNQTCRVGHPFLRKCLTFPP